MQEAHPIDSLSEGEPEVYYEEDGAILAEIDEDEEADIPIFAYAWETGEEVVFCIPEEGHPHIRILYIKTLENGMQTLLDFIVRRFGLKELVFINVQNKELLHALDNPSTKTKRIDGDRALIAEVTWEVDDDTADE